MDSERQRALRETHWLSVNQLQADYIWFIYRHSLISPLFLCGRPLFTNQHNYLIYWHWIIWGFFFLVVSAWDFWKVWDFFELSIVILGHLGTGVDQKQELYVLGILTHSLWTPFVFGRDWTFFAWWGLAPSLKKGTEYFLLCIIVSECELGNASRCDDCPSWGLFLARPAGHQHEVEDQGPPNEGGERATRSVFTWTQEKWCFS